MKLILAQIIFISTIVASCAGQEETCKDWLDGWSKIFRICGPSTKTFMTQKDDVQCIVSYDKEREIYTWTRIQRDPTQECFTIEETVESQQPLDIFNQIDKKFLQEQENEATLLIPFECIQEAKET